VRHALLATPTGNRPRGCQGPGCVVKSLTGFGPVLVHYQNL